MSNREIVSGASTKTLTHEVGAGAPCLKCGDKCPGLDLHFWRKICRNCKCKQEDHDVTTSVSSRGIDNIGKLLMQDSGEKARPTAAVKAESPSQSPVKTVKPPAKKITPPPPASKPEKQTSTFTTTLNDSRKENGNTDANKKASVTVTFDTKSQQKTEPPESFPVPPLPSNYEPAGDFPAPPPPLSSDAAPEAPPTVPPLPEEFQEKAVIPKETASTESTPNVAISEQEPLPPPPSSATTAKEVEIAPPSGGKQDYEWAPPVPENLVQDYIQALPEDKQPIAGSEGAKYRKKQLMRQLPTHDQETSECHDLTSQEKDEMNAFVKKYREKALGVGNVEEGSKAKTCTECNEALKVGEPIVWAERAGTDKQWHPKCFVCSECKELLVDLIYFYNDEKIYCGRHYCELHKPRCSACDELIFAPEYTQAEDSFWHLKHFCCWHCDQPLGGQNYVPHDNQPVCIPCYEKEFAHKCTACKEVIAPNTEWVTFETFHWHAQPECFKCSQCTQSLVGKPCIPKGEMVFCSSKCKKEKLEAN